MFRRKTRRRNYNFKKQRQTENSPRRAESPQAEDPPHESATSQPQECPLIKAQTPEDPPHESATSQPQECPLIQAQTPEEPAQASTSQPQAKTSNMPPASAVTTEVLETEKGTLSKFLCLNISTVECQEESSTMSVAQSVAVDEDSDEATMLHETSLNGYDDFIDVNDEWNMKDKKKPNRFGVSPRKKKKLINRSSGAIQKRKPDSIVHAVKRAVQMIHRRQYKNLKTHNTENISGIYEYTASQLGRRPFDSSNSVDTRIHSCTSEICSGMEKEMVQKTYTASGYMTVTYEAPVPNNVLKPVNRQLSPGGDVFDKLSFTPLKTREKSDRLEQGPKIIHSMNTDCEEDSLDNKENDENAGPHIDNIIPNTSPLKELHNPNFSINTEISRTSDLSVCAQRSSTESKFVPSPLQSIPEESQNSDRQIFATTILDTTYIKESPNASERKPRATWDINPHNRLKFETYARAHTETQMLLKTDKRLMTTFTDMRSLNATRKGNLRTLIGPNFNDEEAVSKFEAEAKRWLNYILTSPADLDCNVEQKIDVGKAWFENRNKEVPLAPTKKQVSSAYHNSHRLDSLRRAAQALLMSPEICQVFRKLTEQIEKNRIVIRTDRNLHLDVGLQKAILELLLCYNPLWLRIGLEALYCLTLPLKSNSDIDGLTTFIIQMMFKNTNLRNKHSKASATNKLSYKEAIKKFTLKKLFMLVYFLDQAKQRKLISHDPCLFRRNAICKKSKEIVTRFTRELITDRGKEHLIITQLGPLGYVVCHKQTNLDEYLYAVRNIAVDIRDGVRLTKVTGIILMKNGLLNKLRTPAISRQQKIHNVQVALNALKDANFVIVGEITATDIADGHREKTMSLLWQLIHVFQAPLFESAANVIQTWWKKKYKVIVEKRMAEERERQRLDNAACAIQC